MITLKRTDGSIIAECDTDCMVEAAVMNKANLCEANLRGANLCEANLRGADLCEANLRGADLCEANLRGADLSEANLRGANLRGADLSGADLCGADLRGAKGIISIGPIASEGRIIYVVNHGDKIMVQAGCFWGSVDELREAVKKTHNINQHAEAYNAAIDFSTAYSKAYNWADEKGDF